MMDKVKQSIFYLSAVVFGFTSCWIIFNLKVLSGFYQSLLQSVTHRGIVYCVLFVFVSILFALLRNGCLALVTDKIKKMLINIVFFIVDLLAIATIVLLCEKYVIDWQEFTIHTLNYLLYVFAWYSLLKAMKIWSKYGNFYKLLLDGKIRHYLIILLLVVVALNLICFSQHLISLTSAVGMLLVSMCVLSSLCLCFTIVVSRVKNIRQFILNSWNETETRIKNNEKPKEVSIAYDQISAVGLSSIICKRLFDIHKNVDCQFIISKLFKMVCYLISLTTTCVHTNQIKKIKISLSFFSCVIISLLCLSYSGSFHIFLVNHPNVSFCANKIIDFVFLPLGIVKVLIQIITIIVAKKTTGISCLYFTIATFFAILTALNLIAKGNFYDTTITMSLFKGSLYAAVVFVAFVLNKIYKK